MKKGILAVLVAMALGFGVQAQTAVELAKDRQELNKTLKNGLEAKPTKDARKLAKEYKKAGWLVPAGEPSIEQQIMRSQYLANEIMNDDYGNSTNRFFQHTSISTARTYNSAYAAGRANAQVEIATLLGSEIAAAMQAKLDNSQNDANNATSVDKFNQRMRSIVHESLSNSIPAVVLYRQLENDNFEVSVRIAYDKKETMARIKKALQDELEVEGNELNGMLGDAFNNSGY